MLHNFHECGCLKHANCKLQALNSILSSLLHYSHSIFSANDQTELLFGMNWGKLFKRDFN